MTEEALHQERLLYRGRRESLRSANASAAVRRPVRVSAAGLRPVRACPCRRHRNPASRRLRRHPVQDAVVRAYRRACPGRLFRRPVRLRQAVSVVPSKECTSVHFARARNSWRCRAREQLPRQTS